MEKDTNMMDDEVIITLETEDGEEVDCIVLTIFQVKDQEYAALLPKDEADDDDAEVIFFRYSEDEEGNALLDSIDDDDEYEAATDAFDEFLDTIEFDQFGNVKE